MLRGLSHYFVLLLALSWLMPPVQAQSVSLSTVTSRIDLSGKMDWLKDESGQLGIHEVAASHAFRPLAGDLNMGFMPAAVWLRIRVTSTPSAPDHWLLEIGNALLDDLRLYTQAADGSFNERRGGDRLARELWEMDYRHPLFNLDLATHGPQTVWLRVQSVNSVSARLLLWQPEAFHQEARTETLLYGLFFGVCLTILIFHMFFWRWSREPVAGWYAFYVASIGLIASLATGYFQQYAKWSGAATDAMLGVLLCSVLWSTTQFAVIQLELGTVLPRLRRLLVTGSALLSGLFIVTTLTLGYAAGVMPAQLVSLVWFVLLLALPTWLWWHGHPPARFFTLAFGVFLAGGILSYGRTLGLVEPNWLTEHGYQIGAIIHMLMMSLAISGRYYTIKREKLAAQVAVNKLLEEQIAKRIASLKLEIGRRETLEIELRQALAVEQQARQQQRDFVAMVSHEFRTPLAIINTSVHHVARNLDASQARSLERCGHIRDSVARMTDLMDDYLSLDRVEDESQVMRLDACDIAEVVKDVLAEWPVEMVELKEIELPPTLRCDSKLVQVAVHNLVANGLRHSPAGVALQIVLSGQSGEGVCIEVTDRGSGIPVDEIGRVFEKYFRGRGAVGKPGAGLGLYIVQRIAQLHGGSVGVRSQAGQGSTFVLTLPGRHVFKRRSTDGSAESAGSGAPFADV